MEHLSNDHEDHPNQHGNSHKLWDETGHPVMNLMGKSMETETRSEFPMEGKPLLNKY